MDQHLRPIDADNHYYEALDACTRYLDPEFKRRGVRMVQQGKRTLALMGDQVNHFIPNPGFDPIIVPGCLDPLFRGQVPEGVDPRTLMQVEPIRPEYRDHDVRVRVLEDQGLDGAVLFPTFACGVEQGLRFDIPALMATLHAFNCWLEEDWGFAHRDRIFAAPYLSLCDVDWAVRELEWALDRGARVIVLRPAAVFTETGPRTPADGSFDPFWARVNEAGVTVVAHAGDSGYTSNGYAPDGFSAAFGDGAQRPSIKILTMERAIYDFLASLVFDQLFLRFPNVRIASVENGSEFLPDMFRKLRSWHRKIPGFFPEDPVDAFRRNVWINPFWEDDVYEIAELMGEDRVIFGSDWPHIEGMPEPLDYVRELKDFDAEARKLILHDTAAELNTLRPA
jgi:predicted TIM-barrel fold metal-dependent hydrolase